MSKWAVAPHVSSVLYIGHLYCWSLCCTVLVDLTVRTLCHCVGNIICYCVYHYLFIEETMVYYCQIFTGIIVAYRLPNLMIPRMYPVVFRHYTVVVAVHCFSAVCSCFLLCTVIVHCKMFVTLFEFLVYLSPLFDKHAVVFTLYTHGALIDIVVFDYIPFQVSLWSTLKHS